ncbi:TetR/AcrR family transcriptional regulator [Rhabdothermincola salaria]|uniref:TetR/AcrR family transcriptional regulator n=1 Tax=Rhabdothermincola salaria TaxID=2903142 RepID=UPI001E4F3843|nr:TetR/AcrR family transcriptional regulator C-terminal domain-containing protein [Rhabdothermincola salaria]MCD9623972.1 TetR/AcrR family transcriptional regulator C-terminal domain-containing protein [Rhabdothermincola salaria]
MAGTEPSDAAAPNPPPRTTRTGRRAGIDRNQIVVAALALADEHGIDAVSMRKVGEAVGVEAMSLYNHVANKDDLLDGMVDAVFAEIELPDLDDPDLDWRTALRNRARSARAAMRRHPWAVTLMETRTSPGPATLRHHDTVLGTMRRSGFSLALAGHALALLDAYVYGFALEEITLPFDEPAGTAELAAAMHEALPADEFPYLAEFTVHHVMVPGYDFAAEFDFGLEIVLDGLAHAFAADTNA